MCEYDACCFTYGGPTGPPVSEERLPALAFAVFVLSFRREREWYSWRVVSLVLVGLTF